jgi:hypothetical protein
VPTMDLSAGGFVAHDALAAVAFFAAMWCAGYAAYSWAVALFPTDRFLAQICHGTVFFWASLVGSAFLLGSFGYLQSYLLLTVVAAVAAASLRFLRAWSRPQPDPREEKGSRSDIAVWGVVFIGMAAFVVENGLLRFPFEFDTINYHLPLIDQWLQAGSLYAPAAGRWSNPGNNEITGLWLVGPFSGDFLVHLNNLMPAVLLACASVELARVVGLRVFWPHLFGLCSVVHFVVLKQLIDCENDVAVAACFFASLFYACRYWRALGSADLCMAAAALGLLMGIKFYAWCYAGLVFGICTLVVCCRHGWSRACKTALVLSLGLALFGGYWYVRNYCVTGSPLYPRQFNGHADVLSRIYPQVSTSSFFGNRDPELLPLYATAIWHKMGLVHLTAFLLAPLSLGWCLVAGAHRFATRRASCDGLDRLAVAAVLVGTGLLLGMTPFAVENRPGTLNQLRMQYCPIRYGLCFLNMSAFAFFLVVSDLHELWYRGGQGPALASSSTRSRLPRLDIFLLVSIVLAAAIIGHLVVLARESYIGQMSNWPATALLGGNVLLALGNVLLIGWLFPGSRAFIKVGVLVGALAVWTTGCVFLSERWHTGHAAHYSKAQVLGLHECSLPAGSKVCSLRTLDYPLFGSHRQVKVYRPMFVESPEWLMDYLQRHEIEFVSIPVLEEARGLQGFSDCCMRYPDVFERMSDNHLSALFAVRRERLALR